MRVLVTHPGMQHSHQLAWALEEAGHLAGFWSGVPVREAGAPSSVLFRRQLSKLRSIPVAASKRRHLVGFPLAQRLLLRRLSQRLSVDLTHRLDHAYDSWVARHVEALKPDMVVSYENAALRTFRAARRVGAVCVLDAASVHYSEQYKQSAAIGQANPTWIDEWKRREIDCADAVLTCSALAADTYITAGIPSGKIFAVPLGTDLPVIPPRAKTQSAFLRIIFVGGVRKLKGIDLLLDVFALLHQESVPARLSLVGDVAEADLAKRARGLPNVSLIPFTPQPALFDIVAAHDVLVLPSRFDSFGMVVPEAMAVGVPALVSDRVGAKCIIEKHPGAGWIVPCDKNAIRSQIMELVRHPEQLILASAAARRAAQDYEWPAYRARVVNRLVEIHRMHMGQGAR